MSVIQRLLCGNSECYFLVFFWWKKFSTARFRKTSLAGTNHQEHGIPSQQERNAATLLTLSQNAPWDYSYLVCILVTPILDKLAMQSWVPFPPALLCSDYSPCPPLFCQVFGDLLIIHCLEHMKNPTGVREVLELLPVCHYKDDMLVSVLKQCTLVSCGVLQLKSAKA